MFILLRLEDFVMLLRRPLRNCAGKLVLSGGSGGQTQQALDVRQTIPTGNKQRRACAGRNIVMLRYDTFYQIRFCGISATTTQE